MTYNIVGIPTATFQDALETFEFNRRIKPDVVSNSVFMPYPHLKARRVAIGQGILDERELNMVFYDKNAACFKEC